MIEPQTEGLAVWIVVYLVLIGGLFWTLYRAMQTKSPKYGYAIFLNVLLMVLLLFI